MENDLTQFEKNLLKVINLNNRTNFNYKHLMEWNSNKESVEKDLVEGEVLYEAMGVFVAIKEK